MDNEPANIDAVIDGCKRQDRKSQEQLYRSFYKAIMGLCVRYTKDENEAVEVMNIGFYKVFKNIERYDSSQASLYTWIRTVVINSCLDFIKSRDRTMKYDEINNSDMETEPEILLKLKEGHILSLVRKLPPATRTVFNLYVIDGYGHKEIAEMLRISEGTSKWHFSEAKKKLKVLLEQEAYN